MPGSLLSILTWCLLLPPAVNADDKAANLELFKQKGFKPVGTVVVATEEAEVDKALKNLKPVYNTVIEARPALGVTSRPVPRTVCLPPGLKNQAAWPLK